MNNFACWYRNRPLVVEDLEPQSIEGLFLSKLHSEVEIVDRWSDVRSLIRDGDISKLVEYATQNNIDFRSLRIEASVAIKSLFVVYFTLKLTLYFCAGEPPDRTAPGGHAQPLAPSATLS